VRFEETAIDGAFVIDIEPIIDERGFFARAWCAREFEAHGLNPRLAQANISYNRHRKTLRGMHFQRAPHEEAKLVRCTRGALYDVILDLRRHSRTFGRWVAYELSASSHRMLYIPEGCAHGFQTLEDNTEVFYQHSEFYAPEYADGVPWNDPAFGIEWPYPDDPILSRKDASWPPFSGR
jgi:dTDP-4-dehydrorhamnose 3,5-epimerase